MSRRNSPVNTPLSLEEVVAILCDQFDDFIQIVVQAWESLQEHPAARTMSWRIKTRSSVVSDAMRMYAIEKYMGREPEGFAILDRTDGLFGVRYKGIVFRFKLLDSNLRTRNILTSQQMSFQHAMSLPGCEELTNVTIGYKLNFAQTDIEKIYLVSEQLGYLWEYELPFNRGYGTIDLFAPEPNAPAPRPRRVTPKAPPTREEEQEVRPANET